MSGHFLTPFFDRIIRLISIEQLKSFPTRKLVLNDTLERVLSNGCHIVNILCVVDLHCENSGRADPNFMFMLPSALALAQFLAETISFQTSIFGIWPLNPSSTIEQLVSFPKWSKNSSLESYLEFICSLSFGKKVWIGTHVTTRTPTRKAPECANVSGKFLVIISVEVTFKRLASTRIEAPE
jgi:hypothetical protein